MICQSGVWVKLGRDCPYWVGDLNWLEGTAGQSGCINGNGLGNAPSAEWFFIEYTRHVNSGNYFVSQRAVGMTGSSAGQIWIRSQQSGSAGSGWGTWTKIMAGMIIRDSALYPFASCPSGTSFLGAMSASGMAVATAEANYWRWINSAGQVWFCG